MGAVTAVARFVEAGAGNRVVFGRSVGSASATWARSRASPAAENGGSFGEMVQTAGKSQLYPRTRIRQMLAYWGWPPLTTGAGPPGATVYRQRGGGAVRSFGKAGMNRSLTHVSGGGLVTVVAEWRTWTTPRVQPVSHQ